MILRHLLHFDLIHLIPGISLDSRYRRGVVHEAAQLLLLGLLPEIEVRRCAQANTSLPHSTGRPRKRAAAQDAQVSAMQFLQPQLKEDMAWLSKKGSAHAASALKTSDP